MAKVVYGPTVSDARNKQGGTVFTKSRSGPMIRSKVSPTQPHSTAQMNVRANFSALAKAWSGGAMSDAYRAGWNALAASYPQKDVFGASRTLTGLQLFIRLNRNRASAGLGAIYAAPASLTAPYPGALTITATAPGTLSIVPAVDCTGTESWLAFASAPQSVGRAFQEGKLRLIGYGGGSSPYDISTAYVAKFGSFTAGQKICVSLVYITNATGAASIGSTQLKIAS